ncbi:MAG: DNA mismatch repair protein MutS, partial [Rhodobacteraceae bacterium]
DIFCSGAGLAKKNRWVRPEITEGKDFLINNGRHPVVEKSLKVSNLNDFIPNSCELLEKKSFINLLTGPNMAGKSTFLRQNALIGILAQIGSYVPADSAKIGRISQVFCRIGASDNLAKGESTFMVEMRETASILNNADNRALVILDEVGRGTSTYDGMSIAWACLEYLHDHNKARTIFATHYHELTDMSKDFIGIQNLSVSAKEWKGELIFLHKVLEGKAVGSYGIKVAELAGLPKKVIETSSNILDKLSRESNFSELTKNANNTNTNEKENYDKNLKILMETMNDLDLDSTTPKLALEILYEVKTRLIEV